MLRLANAALVALAAAVGAAAAVDALRARPEAPPEEAVRALGARGELLFSDERCARARLALPSLRVEPVARIVGCEVFGHRGSIGVVRGEVGWYAYPGGASMLLTRPQLERATGIRGATVAAAAWLENTRFAALVADPGSDRRVLMLFVRERVERVVGPLDGGYGELRSSPRGGWFAALARDGRVALYDGRGDEAPLPSAADRPHAIAWSRDDRLAAVADRRGLVLFRPGSSGGAVRLDVRAHDLAWRR